MSEQPSDVETEAGRRTIARFLMADNAKCFSGDDLLQYLQAERPDLSEDAMREAIGELRGLINEATVTIAWSDRMNSCG
jgi:hypothetical protein